MIYRLEHKEYVSSLDNLKFLERVMKIGSSEGI